MSESQRPTIILNNNTLTFTGTWTTASLTSDIFQTTAATLPAATAVTLDLTDIDALDTNGACLIEQFVLQLDDAKIAYQFTYRDDEQQQLMELVIKDSETTVPEIPAQFSWLPSMGAHALELKKQTLTFIAFFGQVSEVAWGWIKAPQKIRWIPIFHGIDTTGYRAIGIVALLSFLIGVVLCYQMGVQLQSYGASIYVVDLLGMSVLREFAPLLTAIIVAGRTGSAFAAQIGTMKLNQEIDALNTMGLSSMEYLVLPKIVALTIALPLLTVLSMLAGVFGGMVMAKLLFSITYVDFLTRFASVIEVKMLVLGMIKTPVFAVLIATIGCFQGLQVSNSAESVGQRTTVSVVHAIFMIIIADAFFSVLYSKLGL